MEVLSVHWSDVFVGAALGLPAEVEQDSSAAREEHTEAVLVEKVGAAGEGTSLPPYRAGVVLRCNSLQVGPPPLLVPYALMYCAVLCAAIGCG